jgi:hypothetical protein
MSFRTALAISLLTLTTGVASAAATKPAADTACTEHVKKMEAMKTKKERTDYCKANEECSSHQCAKMVSHHKSAKHTSTTPKTKTN